MLSWDRSLYHIWGLSGQSVGLISSLFTITDYIYIIFKYLLFILLCRNRCTIRAVTSQTSWRQLLVRTHSIAVCFFNLVCGWFLFFFWVFTLRFLKKLQDLVYTAVEISCCVALCTIDAILCLTFAQHVLPTHLVTKQLLSTLDLASFMVSLLHLRLTLNTHCSGLRPTFEVQHSSLPVSWPC